jgi:hypothetical protein
MFLKIVYLHNTNMNNNLTWWTGVVEDRNDPEKLGRCRVRIFGYHIDDTNILPTGDLPWALPIQPITSAATSGVGNSPVGIVPGSWVVGFFLDGEDAQQPVIMGTIAGKPSINRETTSKIKQTRELNNVLKDSNGNTVYDNDGEPIPLRNPEVTDKNSFYPLKEGDVNVLLTSLATKLSDRDPTKEGEAGELGLYQISPASLVSLGYLRRPSGGIVDETTAEDENSWTGKDGIRNKSAFLNSNAIQETAMISLIQKNYNTLVRLNKITDNTSVPIAAGLLASAHVVGPKNADKFDKKDTYGTKARDFFYIGNSSLNGEDKDYEQIFEDAQNYLADNLTSSPTQPLNNEELSKLKGFQDPNKKYPKFEYAGQSDVNKLAIGDMTHLSYKIKENNRAEKIQLARTSQTWDEPDTASGAVYPYNQVIETEAGHVIELDSTPNAERIHIFHKKGTYIEVDVNGSMVRKTVGDNYELLDRNNFVYVRGAQTLTVEGKTSILVKDNASIEVEGDVSVTGHGETLVQTAGTLGLVSENIILSAKKGLDIVSDESINIQGKNINMHSKGGALNIKSDRDLSIQSGTSGSLSLKGGLALLLDAVLVKTKMGANIIKPLSLGTIPTPDKRSPDKSQMEVLRRVIPKDEAFLFDSGEDGSEQYKQDQIDRGRINDDIESYISPASSYSQSRTQPTFVDTSETRNFKTFPRSFRLSKYYTLGDLLVGNRGTALVAQKGLSEAQIVGNLKILAVNCLDPIREKYKDVIITSGFRLGPENSDHNIGAAADLMFKNTAFRNYKDIAEWIATNIPFRQLLLEYRFNESSDKLEVSWIHISLLTANGSIVKSSRSAVATFKNHSSFAKDRFVNLA